MSSGITSTQLIVAACAPLVGSALGGLFGTRFLGPVLTRRAVHTLTILGVAVSFAVSLWVLQSVLGGARFNETMYTWAIVGDLRMEVGFLVDGLTAMMMCVVTFVSLMVHIYTIGYMADDDGYNRFFSYISLFTFSMMMLVMSNNLLQLFFGWEAVGLVSYLLIGFWYKKPTAIFANMKAFLVNRVGDFGFIVGIGLLLAFAGTLNYSELFVAAKSLEAVIVPGTTWSLVTAACICLFIGAMGKSAQFPLHVWLPDSMEGPTPISALIHAATMVTAGIFMVARMSPLFELSDIALNFVMVIGAITALFMGFLGIIQNDIKRVVAYSTLSQLGYMTVALGASAYSVAVFHLMTHAFFKALLFLAAGSVIIGMHHNQDIRFMGGLKKYMPITWLTSLVGSLALIGTPLFSGFYSKDEIIAAVHQSNLPGAGFAYFSVLIGVYITAFYSFRMYFLVFHGRERFHEFSNHVDDSHHHGACSEKPHESPWVVTFPLVMLAIPSVVVGLLTIKPMLFGDFLRDAVIVDLDRHPAMAVLAKEFHGAWAMAVHGLTSAPFWLATAGVASAFYLYMMNPGLAENLKNRFRFIYQILDHKYYMDWINENVIAVVARGLGATFWKVGDLAVIDGAVVNGSWRLAGGFASVLRKIQTGFLYDYALAMILGVFGLLTIFVWLK
ncbi:MAG: NADH-quinone oxidoreductase subunit L [Rhodoferax sp.]